MAEQAHDGPSGLQIHPMDQFEIKSLFGGEGVNTFTISNATLWMGLTVLVIALLFVVGSRGRALIPSRTQSVGEIIYSFGHSMVRDSAGKDAMAFFPVVMTVFLFVLFSNLLGLLPYSLAPMAQIAITATMAFALFIMITAVGFFKNGAGFLALFWVTSAPLAIRPVLALIEVISYFVRPVSHSIRLAGNIMAGHAVVKVFAGFAGVFGTAAFGVGALAPILAISALYGLELLVACIQAYIFAILTCVYLQGALHPSH